MPVFSFRQHHFHGQAVLGAILPLRSYRVPYGRTEKSAVPSHGRNAHFIRRIGSLFVPWRMARLKVALVMDVVSHSSSTVEFRKHFRYRDLWAQR
jgi:hypothetical protein